MKIFLPQIAQKKQISHRKCSEMVINRNRIIEIDRVDSTNSYAERLLKERKIPEGTIIWAQEQTAGKGQGNNVWLSEASKNLTISMILYPRFLPVDQQFILNKAVSLGVIDFVHTILPSGSCKIKWPNDIFYGSSKLGGILINHSISGNSFDTSIIGIGINVNQIRFDPSIPHPVSIKQIINNETDMKNAINSLIMMLDHRYDQLKKGDLSLLDQEYKKNLLGFDEERRFRKDLDSFIGIIRDVDHFGRLIIETSDYKRLTFSHKEIEFLF